MTLDEAKKVGFVIGHADSACSCCVGNLVKKMNVAFPEFVWEMGEDIPTDFGPEDDEYDDPLPARIEVLVSEAAPSQEHPLG